MVNWGRGLVVNVVVWVIRRQSLDRRTCEA